MKNISKLLNFIILASILATACKNKKEAQSNADIPGGSWTAITLRGDTLIESDFLRGLPNIIFRDSSLFSGSTGCNQYNARYTRDGNKVNIEVGSITKMACPGNMESVFLKALDETNLVKLDKEILRLYNENIELVSFRKSNSL